MCDDGFVRIGRNEINNDFKDFLNFQCASSPDRVASQVSPVLNIIIILDFS